VTHQHDFKTRAMLAWFHWLLNKIVLLWHDFFVIISLWH